MLINKWLLQKPLYSANIKTDKKKDDALPFPPMCDDCPADLALERGNGELECCSAVYFKDRAVTS